MRNIRKRLAALLILCFAVSLAPLALADDATGGPCGDNLTWTLVDGMLTISGEGEMEDYLSYDGMPWYSQQETITGVVMEGGVTSVGNHAFHGCRSLTDVTIPDSVTSIGDYAFSGCRSLTSVAIPNAVTAIGDDAFLGCSSLISVTIPDSVTSIGSDAFYECSSLASVTLPDNVTSIGGGVFCGCSSLTSVTLPDNVTSIGGGVFCGCSSLTSVTISDSVAYIGSYAFYRCNALTDVYYGGDEASWNAITIDDGNEPLAAATIHYNSAANETGFADVAASDYFYAPVVWAVEQGVTTGTSATTFSPSDACTRGQIITFLWRAAGSPAPTSSGAFSDVDADEYYADAAQWASEQGLDLSDGTFRPADPCTRATVVEYLYRLADSPAVTAAADFTDVSAADAVAWAVEQGVTTGTSATTFSPSDTCTRGQIVTFLYRALA
ncbi:MAG: leucine-rich repeat protein [Oscillospiraceae bacterium]|nr:leucine-rich repeat protein [Oscillospiraceae bacterium]